MNPIIHIKTISEIGSFLGGHQTLHPLISIFKHETDTRIKITNERICPHFYVISLKSDIEGSYNYGRSTYDFNEGTVLFSAPGQIFEITEDLPLDFNGWTLAFHPDLILKSKLHQTIQNFNFFSYEVNEALHVSNREKAILTSFARNIENEISNNMDRHSQNLIIQNIESILKYSDRFYERQFTTRSNINKDIIAKFEEYLRAYLASDRLGRHGLPSIVECGEALGMSGYYLSGLIKSETGKSIKEHMHLKLIDKAKYHLLNSNTSVKELAYDLGFDYPQYFSRLFKSKTGSSPIEYRNLLKKSSNKHS